MSKLEQNTFDFDAKPEALLTPDEIFSQANEKLLRTLKEDRRIERKPARFMGGSLGVYLSMWANTAPDGGLIVVGQRDGDDGFEGCKDLDLKTINKIENVGHTFCSDAQYQVNRVEVRNSKQERDFVLLFRVFFHRQKVVKTSKGDAYIRRSDGKHKLKPEELRELAADKGQVSFEEEECRLQYPDDFDVDALSQWATSVKHKMDSGHDLSPVEIAVNRHLGRVESGQFHPNLAFTFLFARDPMAVFPGCKIRFLRFDGEEEGTGERYNAVKDIWIEGNIPEIISRVEEVIKSQLRTFSPIGKDAKFTHIDEYPKLAWYEAVVNACVHRSYGNGMKNIPIFVKMFDNRLVIESPGPFPPFVTPANIYEMHAPRNPRLMEAMFFLDLVRMNREGTRRMRDTMKEMGLPEPEFSQKQISHALVRVTLRNDIIHRKALIDFNVSKFVSEAIAADMSENERRLVNWVAERGNIRINGAVKLLGISWQSARKLLHGLCQKRILQYIRFRPFEKDKRDVRAYFRLRSSNPLPEGAHEHVFG